VMMCVLFFCRGRRRRRRRKKRRERERRTEGKNNAKRNKKKAYLVDDGAGHDVAAAVGVAHVALGGEDCCRVFLGWRRRAEE
jgi:hypothetical protein